MIKNYTPKAYDGLDPLPDYVSDRWTYTLVGTVPGGYKVTLAELTVGNSISANNPLAHALYKSYTDHGERRKITRSRAGGYDRELTAVKNAMREAGVEFLPALPNSSETILYALGEWMQANNPDIEAFEVMSQNCH